MLLPKTIKKVRLERRTTKSSIFKNYDLLFAKQSLQYTGRSSLGLKGTLQDFPHDAQTASNISRAPPLEVPLAFLRASRQDLQRCGSFVKPLEA